MHLFVNKLSLGDVYSTTTARPFMAKGGTKNARRRSSISGKRNFTPSSQIIIAGREIELASPICVRASISCPFLSVRLPNHSIGPRVSRVQNRACSVTGHTSMKDIPRNVLPSRSKDVGQRQHEKKRSLIQSSVMWTQRVPLPGILRRCNYRGCTTSK